MSDRAEPSAGVFIETGEEAFAIWLLAWVAFPLWMVVI